MIPQRNISLIANTLVSANGRRIPESVIERDYCPAWFLTGLARHSLRDILAFKGGTALRRCWFADYRFSEDLDFTLIRPITFDEIRAGLDQIFADVDAASGMRMAFDHEDRHGHQNSHTFYLRYQGPLPASNDVKVDITIDESLQFHLEDRPILKSYEAYEDLLNGPTIRAYSLREHRREARRIE
ncbi:MAG: nucleotidyl transferase AbiEii/AbiGii toxin family protein [Casimicrobiaceae bacterium]